MHADNGWDGSGWLCDGAGSHVHRCGFRGAASHCCGSQMRERPTGDWLDQPEKIVLGVALFKSYYYYYYYTAQLKLKQLKTK